jgi:hypothetical protein
MSSTGPAAYRATQAVTARAIVLVVTLALGCARQSDLVIGDQPDSDLASLVDSDAARQMLGHLLARRAGPMRLAAGAPSDTRPPRRYP